MTEEEIDIRRRVCSRLLASMIYLLVASTWVWSADILRAPKDLQSLISEGAVVTKIEGNIVTVQSKRDKSKELNVEVSNPGEFAVGDQVRVEMKLMKWGAMPEPIPKPQWKPEPTPERKDLERPAAIPEPIPRPPK